MDIEYIPLEVLKLIIRDINHDVKKIKLLEIQIKDKEGPSKNLLEQIIIYLQILMN